MKYKVTRVDKSTFNVYQHIFGCLWRKIESKPSWALAKRFVNGLGYRTFIYEELWQR